MKAPGAPQLQQIRELVEELDRRINSDDPAMHGHPQGVTVLGVWDPDCSQCRQQEERSSLKNELLDLARYVQAVMTMKALTASQNRGKAGRDMAARNTHLIERAIAAVGCNVTAVQDKLEAAGAPSFDRETIRKRRKALPRT